MSKITKFAEGKNCTARIPGVCNHNPETSVWAHLNAIRWGSGKGVKVKDACGLIACSDCHDVIDGRVPSEHSAKYIMLCSYEGHMESLAMLIEEGVLLVY